MQAALLYSVGELDDKIKTVVTFWTIVYQGAEHPWKVTMPELDPHFQPLQIEDDLRPHPSGLDGEND